MKELCPYCARPVADHLPADFEYCDKQLTRLERLATKQDLLQVLTTTAEDIAVDAHELQQAEQQCGMSLDVYRSKLQAELDVLDLAYKSIKERISQ